MTDGIQTSDAFWRSARVLVSELSFKWYSFMFLVLFGSILVEISDFSEIQLVCDLRTDGPTNRLTCPLTLQLLRTKDQTNGKEWLRKKLR